MSARPEPGSTDSCPFEAILRVRDSGTKETEYLMKFLNRKYADSKWLPKSEVLRFPEGKSMINRFAKKSRSESSNRNYDPMFDKIDSIVLDEDGRYLVLWCKLGFEDPTWETKVDENALRIYNSRKAAGFPERRADVKRPPVEGVQPVKAWDKLTLRETMTLNRFVNAYKQEKDVILTDPMNFQSVRAGVAFLQLLQQNGDHGPFLVVTDNVSRWTEQLKSCPELLTLVYGGSDEARERMQSWFFDQEGEQVRFHVVVSSLADAFGRGVNLLSKVNYRVAIFNMPNAKQMYKSFGLVIGRSICMAASDAGNYARELNILAELCSMKEVEPLVPHEAVRRAKEALSSLQPAIQRLNKHGDANFVCPPTQTINCPLSLYQKLVCQAILSRFKENPRIAAEKVLRTCSHAFLVDGAEYALRGVDFLQASTKLMVLDCLLRKCQEESLSLLIIAQFSGNIDLIIDLLGTRDITFYHYSTMYEESMSQEEHMVSIFNPRWAKNGVDMGQFNCVVIFDGATAAWKEMVNNHRRSRAPTFNVTQVFSLECRDCCERELLSVCGPATFNEKRAEQACKAAAVHAFSNFAVENAEQLVNDADVLDEQLFTQPILQFLQETDENFWTMFTFDESRINTREPVKTESMHNWTVHERNQLVRGLFRFGFGRWNAIQRTCGLFVPKEAMQSAGKALIRDLLQVAQNATGYGIARQFVATDDESEVSAQQTFIESSCFGSEFFLSTMRKVANPLLKRIEFLFYLDSSLGGSEMTASEIPTFRLGGAMLTDWWTEEYDKALVYVTWKYGFGVYDHVYESLNDKLCKVITDFPEVIEEKRLEERSLRLCEVAKRTPMSDERVIKNLCDRVSSWPKEDQEKAISTILKFGIRLDKEGLKDYAWFKETSGLSNHSDEAIADYVDELLKQCQNPGSGNNISYDTAMRVTQRVGAMRQLREVLAKPEDKLTEIFSTLPHWRNLPRKWTPELELYYFQLIEAHGFGSYEEILANDDFSDVFENGIPASFLLSSDAVIKRINMIFYYMNHKPAPKPSKKKSSSSSSSAPAKKITGISIKDLKGGNVTYPVAVTQTSQILEIGHIVSDRPGFHSERYIYPAGYKATRLYSALKRPDDRVTWISEIVDTGKKNPVFRVYQEDEPDKVFEGDTPSSPWVQVLKAVAAAKREKRSNTISGPEAYLLASPITSYLIQHLPGARDCEKYKWRPIDGED